ncbi:MAG: hypothetical protein ACK5MT_08265 [Actinomycetales bacterium]
MLPMLATPAADAASLPRGADWTYEVKWDGMRVITERSAATGRRLRMTSRRGNVVHTAYPELTEEGVLAGLADDVLLDGEVVAFADGRPSFQTLAGRIHVRDERRAARLAATVPVTYLVFDLLRLDGVDLTTRPWHERRALLERLDLPALSPRWQVPPSYDDGSVLLQATAAQGLEGVVAKRRTSKYYPGRRSPDWVKLAHRSTLTCAIAGWTTQAESTSVLGAVWMAVPDRAGGWRTLGRCGAGLVGAAGARVKELITRHPRPDSPYTELPDDPDVKRTRWVEPRVLIDVRYLGTDDSGRLRQPVFHGLRSDLEVADLAEDPAEVEREETGR